MTRTLGILALVALPILPLFGEDDITPASTEEASVQQDQPAPKREVPDYIRNAPPPELPKNLPDAEELQRQFVLLEEFLELPPEELARIRKTIERIEAMDPARREEMRRTLRMIRNLDPQEQLFLREVSNHAAESLRPELEDRWRQLLPDRRNTLMQYLQALPVEKRGDFLTDFANTGEIPDLETVEAESESAD